MNTPVHPAAWRMVVIFSIAYAFSFVDRQILNLLVQPIRASLAIDDVQFSLLQGFAFAVTYGIVGLPLGLYADRGYRKGLIATGILVWSVATIACGFADSFAWLFVARVFVGVGEAALVPAVYSMLADAFPEQKRARPMAVFMSGSTVGAGLALLIGGIALTGASTATLYTIPYIGELPNWRLTFLIVGLPGILLALLVAVAIPEPERRIRPSPGKGEGGPKAQSHSGNILVLICIGFSLFSLAVYGLLAWTPEFFRRSHGWAPAEFALQAGPLQIVVSLVGALAAGSLIDRRQANGRSDAVFAFSIIIALGLALLIGLAMIVRPASLSLAMLTACWLLIGAMLPAPGIALQLVTPPNRLAFTSALFLMIANIIGIGGGPTAVALTAKHVFQEESALDKAVALTCGVALLSSLFFLSAARAAMQRFRASGIPESHSITTPANRTASTGKGL